MNASSDLVLYRPSPSSSPLIALSIPGSRALTSSLFSQSTGTAIATELLYRILWDIMNRLLTHFHRFAVERLDDLHAFMERRAISSQEARARAKVEKSEILKEVVAVREEGAGGVGHGPGFGVACPLTGKGVEKGRGGPPSWVLSVLQGAEEGRIERREFWINGLVG